MKFKFTKEQKLIRKQDFLSKSVYKIIAYAGAGKTTMLQRLAKDILNEDPRCNILYLAYNRSISDEAKTKFPARVRCSTVHGFAFAHVGKKYPINQLREISNPNIISAIPDKYKKNKLKWPFVHMIKRSINNFLYSSDDWMEMKHMDRGVKDKISKDLLATCKLIWERMQDPGDWFPITHDGYLKLYQLSKPDLGRMYDVIMIDEAQDCNGATMGIIDGSSGCCKIWVGDPHQQIYGWRGSVNALGKVEATELRLSKSFRFGSNISNIASKILYELKGESVPVRGINVKDQVIVKDVPPKRRPITYISRTNAELFERAVKCVKKKEKHCFIGGWDKNFGKNLLDVFNLHYFNKKEIKNEFIKFFDDTDALKIYSVQSKEFELLRMINTVQKYGSDLPSLLIKIKDNEVKEKEADVILTTGHKCKGLEWDYVYVASDFAESLVKAKSGEAEYIDDELNLIYVSCTRARKKLYMNKDLARILQFGEEKDE